jgi:hypothetical protein
MRLAVDFLLNDRTCRTNLLAMDTLRGDAMEQTIFELALIVAVGIFLAWKWI